MDDIVAAARELVPLLRAEAAETERLGRLTDPAVAALREAGMFSLLTPRSCGGVGADARAVVAATTELGRGCGSSAWVCGVFAACSFLVALFGDQARAEVWGADPAAAICGTTSGSGGATRAEGGVIVSGTWRTASGIRHAQWVTLFTPVAGADGVVTGQLAALLPAGQVVVHDTWDSSGLRGTGTESFTVTEAFVPEHRLLSVPALLAGQYAGGHPGEPIAAMTFSSFLPVSLAGALIGMARGTLEHVLDVLAAGRPMGLTTYASAAASPSVQFDVADAASLIDTATLHAERAVGDIERGIAGGAPLDVATRARIRMDVGTVTRCARSAAGLLASAGGMGSFAASSPVQRHLRDLDVAARHASLSPRLSREVYGRDLLGLDEQVVRII